MAFIRRRQLASEFSALDGVSFSVAPGEAVALLGFNGSGKSTMLKMISGVLRPDSGRIATRGRIAGLIEVGAGFHPDLSGRENVYLNAAILGMSKKETDARFDEIVAFSEIEKFIDTEVKHYSSGMFLRLAFSVAIHTEVDILLIDEILSVGDEPFQKKCLARIRELHDQGKTLVVVSHDLDMIAKLCDRGIILRSGQVEYDGDASSAVRRLRKLGWSPFIDLSHEHPAFEAALEMHELGVLPAFERQHGSEKEFRPQSSPSRGEVIRAFNRLVGRDDEPTSEYVAGRSVAAWREHVSLDLPPTRADVAALLHELAGSPAPSAPASARFSDVAGDIGQEAISWLAEAGISRGWDEGRRLPSYRPHEPISREALAVLLTRARPYLAVD